MNHASQPTPVPPGAAVPDHDATHHDAAHHGASHQDATPVERVRTSPAQGVGQRLRALRQERNLLQRELAEAAGLSLNAVSLIERDQTSPTVATLERLAQALDVPVVALFSEPAPVTTVILTRPTDEEWQLPTTRNILDGTVCQFLEMRQAERFIGIDNIYQVVRNAF